MLWYDTLHYSLVLFGGLQKGRTNVLVGLTREIGDGPCFFGYKIFLDTCVLPSQYFRRKIFKRVLIIIGREFVTKIFCS